MKSDRLAGMRDRLIHHYFHVDLDLVWSVVSEHIPPLAAVVDEALRVDEKDR